MANGVDAGIIKVEGGGEGGSKELISKWNAKAIRYACKRELL